MESRNRQDEERAAAARLNAALAKDLARSKRVCLSWTIGLIATAIGFLFIKQTTMFAPPCVIGAFIMFLLYLDARGELRLVKARNWSSPTPRISKLRVPSAASPDAAARG